MESDAAESPFPRIENLHELPRMGERIVEVIRKLEAQWAGGTLSDSLLEDRELSIATPSIVENYIKLPLISDAELVGCRKEWVENALRTFLQTCSTPVIDVTTRNDTHEAVEIDMQDGVVKLRNHQVMSARYWGIGIFPQNESIS